jgi:DNA-binding transcriptional ArsR family regulator
VSTYRVDSWDALGDRTRRKVFERVARRPCAVGEIARGLPVSRPAVSQHLKVLKEAGLVAVQPEGQRRLYVVRPEGISALRDFLASFWPESLRRLKQAAEEAQADAD